MKREYTDDGLLRSITDETVAVGRTIVIHHASEADLPKDSGIGFDWGVRIEWPKGYPNSRYEVFKDRDTAARFAEEIA